MAEVWSLVPRLVDPFSVLFWVEIDLRTVVCGGLVICELRLSVGDTEVPRWALLFGAGFNLSFGKMAASLSSADAPLESNSFRYLSRRFFDDMR